MRLLGMALIATGLLICAAACMPALRNGNGLIGNKQSRPACHIETDYGIKFFDMEDPQCSRSSRSRSAQP